MSMSSPNAILSNICFKCARSFGSWWWCLNLLCWSTYTENIFFCSELIFGRPKTHTFEAFSQHRDQHGLLLPEALDAVEPAERQRDHVLILGHWNKIALLGLIFNNTLLHKLNRPEPSTWFHSSHAYELSLIFEAFHIYLNILIIVCIWLPMGHFCFVEREWSSKMDKLDV